MNARHFLVGACCTAWLSACASSTVIRSNPSGATVKSYGVTLGTTPLTITNTQTVIGSTLLTLEKEGYQSSSVAIQRDQWNAGELILAVLCFLPGICWSADYRPEYVVDLVPAQGATPPPPR